jgi:FixJ family two-component response regulator
MLSPNHDRADASADRVTVLIVDDDPTVRRSVARLIRSAGIEARTFTSPTEFLRHELPDGPACVLLDLSMDGMSGLEVQDELRRNKRQIPIVFLSGHGTISTAALGFKHGADDFLEKPVRPAELMAAVRQAIAHDRSQLARRAGRDGLQRRYDRLTPREQEVMSLVVSGLLNKQAAAELGISEKTIKVHRARVMEKMEVESLAALVVIAERLGVSTQPPGEVPAGDAVAEALGVWAGEPWHPNHG